MREGLVAGERYGSGKAGPVWGVPVPSRNLGDVVSGGQGVEGFGKDGGRAQFIELAPILALHLRRQQNHGYVSRVSVLLENLVRRRTVDVGHHDVEQNGVGLFEGRTANALRSRRGQDDLPAGNGFEAERSHFPYVGF